MVFKMFHHNVGVTVLKYLNNTISLHVTVCVTVAMATSDNVVVGIIWCHTAGRFL